MPRKKKKKSKIPENYLKGSKNRSAKAAEIRRTAEAYRKGEYIDIKAVQKSRVNQDVTKKSKKSTKRKNKSPRDALRQILRDDGTELSLTDLIKKYPKAN